MDSGARLNLPAILRWVIPAAAIVAAGYLAWMSPMFRPSAEQQERMLAEADTEMQHGVLEPAAQKFQRVAALQPGSARARFGLGLVRMRQGRYAEALAAFDTAVRLGPGNSDMDYARARTLTLLGRRDEAIAALATLHEAAPGRVEVDIDRIALLIDAQRWSDAEIAVTDALSRASAQYDLRLQAGRIAGHTGDHAKALEQYAIARQVRPYAPQPVYGLIEEYRALGRIADARVLLPVFETLRKRTADLERLRNAALASPADPAPSITYIERLYKEGWFDEVVEQANVFLNMHSGEPGNRGVLLTAASSAGQIGDTTNALRFLGLAGTEGLSDAENLAIGAVLVEAGELARARTIYEERLRTAPDDPTALIGLGRTELKSNDVEAAEKTFRHAVAVAPRSAEAHAVLGLALAQKTDVDAARTRFETSLALDPRQAEALFGLGFLAQQKGRHDDAERYLKQALDIRPEYVSARVVLALTLSNKGHCDEAIPLFMRALQLDPRNMTLHAGLVRCLEASGKTAEAMQARTFAEGLISKKP